MSWTVTNTIAASLDFIEQTGSGADMSVIQATASRILQARCRATVILKDFETTKLAPLNRQRARSANAEGGGIVNRRQPDPLLGM